MSTEIRRSSRKTKGVNSRLEDLDKIGEPTPRPKKRTASSKANGQKKKQLKRAVKVPEKEEVRCLPCGSHDLNYNEDEDERGVMIQCDKCETWQHAKCLLGTDREDSIPDNYVCNLCDPGNDKYQNLELALSPDDYYKERFPDRIDEIDDQEEEDFEDAGAVYGESDEEYEGNGEKDEEDGDEDEEEEGDEADDLDEPAELEEPEEKVKKPVRRPQKVVRKKVDRNKTRQSVVSQFAKKLKGHIPEDHKLLEQMDVNSAAEDIASGLENALFEAFPPPNKRSDSMSPEYLSKSRTLLFNLDKSNLSDKVLSGQYTYEQIVHLTPEEMMRDDYKEFADAVRKQSINQSVITNTLEKVKIKRTHKGEEIIEEDYQFDDIDSRTADESRRNEIEKLQEEKRLQDEEKEASASPPPTANLNANIMTTIANDFDDEEHEQRPEETFDNDDDFDKILNGTKDVVPTPPESQAVVNDDEDDYDPARNFDVDETLWNGILSFAPVTDVQTTIRYHAASTYDSTEDKVAKARKIVSDFVARNNRLDIEGRLDAQKAVGYLWEIINTRDLYLVELVPFASPHLSEFENQQTQTRFRKLWEYFNSRNKYGVIAYKPAYIKDSYLVALDTTRTQQEGLPKYFSHFNMTSLHGARERLFAVFVARKDLSAASSGAAAANLDQILSGLAA
ncbi:uncharacterized protein OGAPODRAFT_75644 [Ogataea polymorpha]|uniref:uncharacterized protein n=1 Tax=Ogataea polymorpha TaxID=460523 RepID=UPI0007F3A09C|nr:uncharacterized protein OGAPODRAFT_75644 [Ogataea polymorpha]KAG7935614.1 hypothetical protein KL934_002173 [Ogataea polymorpha]OBA17794.1 hypothetical protein OGAPODRAFT_75644 [Ogataea polymorpha]